MDNLAYQEKLLTDGSIEFLQKRSIASTVRLVFEDNHITLTQFFNSALLIPAPFGIRINGERIEQSEERTGSFGRKKIIIKAEILEDAAIEIIDQNTEEVVAFYRAVYEPITEIIANTTCTEPLSRLRRLLR